MTIFGLTYNEFWTVIAAAVLCGIALTDLILIFIAVYLGQIANFLKLINLSLAELVMAGRNYLVRQLGKKD